MFGEEHNSRCIVRVETSLKEQFDFIELALRRELDASRNKSRLSDGLNLKEKNIELSKAYSKIYNQEQQLALKRIDKMFPNTSSDLNEMQRKNDEAISKMQVLNMKIKNGENKKNININDSNKLKLNFNIEKCKHNLYKSVIEHESQICQKLENSLDGEKLPNWYDSTFNELPNLFNQLYYQINEWQNYIQKLHTTDPIMKSISVQTPKYQDTEMKKIAQIEKLNQELTNKNMEIYKLRENIMNMNKTFTNENIHNEVTKSKKNVKIQCKMEKSIHKKSIAVMTSFKKPDSEIADLSCQDSMKRYDDMKKIYKSLTPTEKIHFIKLQKEISDLKEMFQEDDVEKIKNINQTKNCINQLLGVIESNDSNSSCVSSNFQSKKKSTSTSQLKSTLKSLGSNKTKVKINKQLIETLDSMLRERNDDLVEIKSMMNNKLKNKYNKVSTNPKVFNQEKDKFDNLLDEFSSNLKTTDSKYIL
ncbi:hypothetical protein A3Q56_03257 [Intoshia linei]|uniref:Uncharacterized protein n=1 Tax=Intoshia linei TaxID=1819745 RepID=A0A177B4D4_9BILA|nr:hypothetical protein A3Q56_03257 [Intoshia linei]